MKEHLTIQIVGAESNTERLATIPHQMMEDMAVVYRFNFGEVSGGNASIVVTNPMMELYGITQEQLHQDALEAAQKNEPLSIKNMDEIMYEMTGGFAGSVDDPQSPMWIATNESRFNGASAMAYGDFMDQATEKLEGSFYILPSSIHEVIMIPDSFGMKAEELKAMVTSINASEVRPEERLTDNVYHFDAVARIFEQADSFESVPKKHTAENLCWRTWVIRNRLARNRNPRCESSRRKIVQSCKEVNTWRRHDMPQISQMTAVIATSGRITSLDAVWVKKTVTI